MNRDEVCKMVRVAMIVNETAERFRVSVDIMSNDLVKLYVFDDATKECEIVFSTFVGDKHRDGFQLTFDEAIQKIMEYKEDE